MPRPRPAAHAPAIALRHARTRTLPNPGAHPPPPSKARSSCSAALPLGCCGSVPHAEHGQCENTGCRTTDPRTDCARRPTPRTLRGQQNNNASSARGAASPRAPRTFPLRSTRGVVNCHERIDFSCGGRWRRCRSTSKETRQQTRSQNRRHHAGLVMVNSIMHFAYERCETRRERHVCHTVCATVTVCAAPVQSAPYVH